jgi:hypothetical protein
MTLELENMIGLATLLVLVTSAFVLVRSQAKKGIEMAGEAHKTAMRAHLRADEISKSLVGLQVLVTRDVADLRARVEMSTKNVDEHMHSTKEDLREIKETLNSLMREGCARACPPLAR